MTVAIADDHHLVIKGLKQVIANLSNFTIIDEYRNGDEVLAGLKRQVPEMLIMDIHMPGHTGEELAVIISKEYPTVKMLALTNLDSLYYVKSLSQNGVLGYLLKSSNEEVLLTALTTVGSGQSFLDPQLKDQIISETLKKRRKSTDSKVLTTREKEVLHWLSANYSSQEIADKLFVSKRTIDSHRLSLLLKFGVKNSAALIKKAVDLGFLE